MSHQGCSCNQAGSLHMQETDPTDRRRINFQHGARALRWNTSLRGHHLRTLWVHGGSIPAHFTSCADYHRPTPGLDHLHLPTLLPPALAAASTYVCHFDNWQLYNRNCQLDNRNSPHIRFAIDLAPRVVRPSPKVLHDVLTGKPVTSSSSSSITNQRHCRNCVGGALHHVVDQDCTARLGTQFAV